MRLVVVKLSADRHDGVAGAHNTVKHRLNVGGNPLLVFRDLAGLHDGRRISTHRGQHHAVAVDNRNAFGLHVLDRRRDKVNDCLHACRGQCARCSSLDKDGRGGVRRLGYEYRLLRQRKLDGRRAHSVHRADGPRQLTLKSPLVGDLLLELGGCHRHPVKQGVAGVGVGEQAFRCDLQAGVVQLAVRHQDRATAGRQLIRHTRGVEFVNDRCGVRGRKVGEQWRHLRLVDPLREGDGGEHESRAKQDREYALGKRQFFDLLLKAANHRGELSGHQACILMISLKASTARLRMVAVSSIATAA